MFPRKTHVLSMGMLLLLPALVFASALEGLVEDIDALDKEIGESLLEQRQQEADEAYEGSILLYPEEKSVSSSEGFRSGESGGTFVSVRDEGEIVELSDVPRSEWFARYVQDMADRRIITGYRDAAGTPRGLYGPADPVTVEQLAKISVLAAGVDQSKCPRAPKNGKAMGTWSAQYIACAEHLGWSVYQDGSVHPARSALRAEVVTTVLQAFNRKFDPATGTVFKDVSNTMPSRYAIETAARDGIVSGYTDAKGNLTGFFGPFDEVNRAETAKIVSLALRTYGL
ncbi:MAG: S-layer homology domain-containing protein [Candidatus Peribacteraceae bacterium]|nr:S-layer homology domain-containing protein [Candidatus Peribacteraceae bacterium]